MKQSYALIIRTTQAIRIGFSRFPESILCAGLASIFLIIVNHRGEQYLDTLSTIAMMLMLGIPLYWARNAWLERWDVVRWIRICSWLIIPIFLSVYGYLLMDGPETMKWMRYFFVTLTSYLGVLLITHKKSELAIQDIARTLIFQFFKSGLVAVIIGVSFNAMWITADQLFELNTKDNIMQDFWLLLAGWFGPLYYARSIPRLNEWRQVTPVSSYIRAILLNLLMSVSILYALILYVYFFKIIMSTVWPQGWVGNLVFWYGIICVVYFFFLQTYRDEVSRVKTYLRWFPLALLPLLVMMFTAIGIRVREYGMSENRYAVIVVGAWVVVVAMYISLNRRLNVALIPATLAILVLIMGFGPLSSFAVSIRSQNDRIENILNNNHLIQNGIIIKPQLGMLSPEDTNTVLSVLDYFDRSHTNTDLRHLPSGKTIRDIRVWFEGSTSSTTIETDFFNHELEQMPILPIDHTDLFADFSLDTTQEIKQHGEWTLMYDDSKKEFSIERSGKLKFKQSLIQIAEAIHKKFGSQQMVEGSEMTRIVETSTFKVTFVFRDFSGYTELKNKHTYLETCRFYVFIHSKK